MLHLVQAGGHCTDLGPGHGLPARELGPLVHAHAPGRGCLFRGHQDPPVTRAPRQRQRYPGRLGGQLKLHVHSGLGLPGGKQQLLNRP